ncbi:MAG TPA: hypothetical protein DCX32_03890 [Candidatus Moranbacteria bacterium]|nr:hypothetical protein [Candidatus Moranbacteria bacterium]
MKKKALFFLAVWILLPWSVSAQTASENITGYNVQIGVNADSSINISEKIEYDFGVAQKHGIFRNIPVEYKARGGNFKLRVSDISVVDENGKKHDFEKNHEGNDIVLKIGDPDALVTGEKTYVINYKIKRALNYFSDHDELYWNAIGSQWKIPINDPSVEIFFPDASHSLEAFQKECFVGALGSKEKCQIQEYVRGNNFIRFSARDLKGGEGLTFVLGFPKGLVIKPGNTEIILDVLKDNLIFFLPIMVLIGMFYLWHKKGKDPKGRGTIVAQFDAPDNLTPMEVGIILDEKADPKDISATIIDLAVRGHIKIRKIEEKILLFNKTDYELEEIKETEGLKGFEKKFLDYLFSSGNVVKISGLKNNFQEKIKKVTNESYDSVVEGGYFLGDPNTTRNKYLIAAAALVFVGFFLVDFWGIMGFVAIVVSGMIIIAFSFLMPKKTEKGVLAREHILGLKLYLEVAEKDRLDFHNAPEKNPQIFEKLLPYAMVLGVEKKWAGQFEGIYNQSPSWYSDTTPSSIGTFTSLALLDDLKSFSASASSDLGSTAASGGSGFSGGSSGGGGGGGGGGSW